MSKKRVDYTYKYNIDNGRHGWLRLTPAYSIKLVQEIIDSHNLLNPNNSSPAILDPFSGTATTGIVAAENGYNCSLYDVNPFLTWFGNVKSYNYEAEQISQVISELKKGLDSLTYRDDLWKPSIKNIDRWWSIETQNSLSTIRDFICKKWGEPTDNNVSNLLWVAFARLCLDVSAADFNHVSLSFKNETQCVEFSVIKEQLINLFESIADSAKIPLKGKSVIYLGDARLMHIDESYDLVITSPPYPNRISYIRELRPYMYWLKFLNTSQEAGDLDWKAIGGTWGSATSKLMYWEQQAEYLPQELLDVCSLIKSSDAKNGESMGRYVHKFFDDIFLHLKSLRNRLNDGASLNYIIGNSSFYGNHVDTELYMKDILNYLGYKEVASTIIRKRNSKKCLYEYLITAKWKTEE